MIIGIGGTKSAGKDTTANYFIENEGFKKLSFAFPLKQACAAAFDLDFATLDAPELKDKAFDIPIRISLHYVVRLAHALHKYLPDDEFLASKMYPVARLVEVKTPRELLQFVGTDLIRRTIDDQFWCKAMAVELRGQDKVVIPDARFPNERAFLRDQGAKLIRVIRPSDTQATDTHSSENQLGEYRDYDLVVHNDSSIEALHDYVKNWYRGA